ncbi:MAG: MBOAT family protein [Flavobacteriaceae bacterium]|nr:MBOAT family protein [Flavobacteriaceae bacterium]
MLFNSPVFLFFFLPLTLIGYYLTPKKLKNLFLLLASLFFYTWGEKELVVLIMASTFVDYSAGLIIEKGHRKLGLYLSIFFNLGLLFIFKYLNFTVYNLDSALIGLNLDNSFLKSYNEIILPLGISFYTFQTMSYTIDVYKGNVKATKNLINFGTYVALFPQLIAGPIVKYKDVEIQLINRKVDFAKFAEGIERFIIGLAKKMLIANHAAFLVDGIFGMPSEQLSTQLAWLGLVAYSIQLYFDFSGYSDMAIGLGKMFGFDFLENFNFPYISKSIREFWKRWHISLTNWFKEYVYFSLGGSRISVKRTYINLAILFFITGLWHGADWTFILWGMLHGFFIIIERLGLEKWLKKSAVLGHTYMILALFLTWPFVRCNNIGEAWLYFKKMFAFDFFDTSQFNDFYITSEVIAALLIGILFSTRVLLILQEKLVSHREKWGYLTIKYSLLILLFIISCVYISIDSYDPFIYFRF